MRLAKLCLILAFVGLVATSGCGATGVFTMDSSGKKMAFDSPGSISAVESISPPEHADESYRFLMTRCSGAEGEAYERSRRLFGTRLFLQILTATLATVGTLMISVDEVQDGGRFSADTRQNLKIGAAVFGSGAVITSSVLAFGGFEGRLEVSRRLLQQVRRTRDSVRARWWQAQSDKGALLLELAQACGGVPIEDRPLPPPVPPLVKDALPQAVPPQN